jgi:hypothetical protein
MPELLYGEVKGRNIGYSNCYIIRIKCPVVEGSFPSLADARAHPLLVVDPFEKLHYMVLVCRCILDGQVGPIDNHRYRFPKVAVFDKELVGLQQGAQLIQVPAACCITAAITLGDEYDRTVIGQVRNKYPLRKTPLIRMHMVDWLFDIDNLGFTEEAVLLHLLYRDDTGQFLDPLLQRLRNKRKN